MTPEQVEVLKHLQYMEKCEKAIEAAMLLMGYAENVEDENCDSGANTWLHGLVLNMKEHLAFMNQWEVKRTWKGKKS